MKTNVQNIIKSELAIFHNEGLLVFELLNSNISKGNQIELDFENIKRCSTQFLNAAIGKLYMIYPPHVVDSHLKISYGNANCLASKIVDVRNNALNHAEYDLAVSLA